MARSLGAKLERLHALCETHDLTDWEQGFVSDLWVYSAHGQRTSWMSERQVEILGRVYARHFSD
jgi:hypothetical protein